MRIAAAGGLQRPSGRPAGLAGVPKPRGGNPPGLCGAGGDEEPGGCLTTIRILRNIPGKKDKNLSNGVQECRRIKKHRKGG